MKITKEQQREEAIARPCIVRGQGGNVAAFSAFCS